MKKIIPILTIVGAGLLVTGCANNITKVSATDSQDKCDYYEDCKTSNNQTNETKTVLDKYSLSVDTPTTLELTEDNVVEESDENDENSAELEESLENSENNSENTENSSENEEKTEISTLYYLSEDVEESCDEFCELKEEISSAIVETENLIAKLENNEIELTREERLYLNEQAMQLKNLGKQLSSTTTELAFNLSDLKQILSENNADVNELSLKYLIVLDNLVNSNEMLQSGLTSLNMMNRMFYNSPTKNRMMFGYQRNNEPPVIKDYVINENGELTENTETEQTDSENNENQTTDTYSNNKLRTNIDSYYTNHPRNIDTFFNTALLDNEFMYGNGGMGGYSYGFNPYMNQYANYEQTNQNANNTTNDVNNVDNTQQNENLVDEDNEKVGNKERKKFQLKKNIDTYKDANTPDLKTRFNSFKESISGVFGKINPKDNIKNPVYRF